MMSIQRIDTLPHLPARPADGHKGTFGKVLIVAGSRGMSGAAALSGLGALRGGAGLVYLAVPESILTIVAGMEPAWLTVPLSTDRDGSLSEAALGELWAAIDGKEVCAIGPGLGRHGITETLVTSVYEDAELPLVVDADALNCLAETPELLGRHAGSRVLTPHPGEFARLTGTDIADVQNRREELAIHFAQKHRVVLVLKGQHTLVTDGKCLYINQTGNSGMATGGTGDVLTGLLAALLGQHLAPFEAAQLAVFLHGRAGDLVAAELSEPALISSDLPRYLGKAWLSVRE